MIKVFKLKKKSAVYPERKYYTGQVDGNVIKVYTDENKFEVYRLNNNPYNGRLHELLMIGAPPPRLLDYFDIVDVKYTENKHKFYVNFRLKYYNKEKYDEYMQKAWEKLKKEMEQPRDMSVFGF